MEIRLLLWLLLLSALYGLLVLFRRRGGVPLRLFLTLGVLSAIAGTGIAWSDFAPAAAVVSGTGFLAQMVLPGALVRRGRRAAARGRFARAARLLRLAALLLPLEPLRSEASLYHALVGADPGNAAVEEVTRRIRGAAAAEVGARAPAGLALAGAMLAVHVAHLLLGGTDS
ncbi:MAG: hypothetical protein MUE73_19110, partial [Planctomycetes bacterium]|nr:hypothetical protein [Planctomycetota bacterium]